jgi:hypothetical protein
MAPQLGAPAEYGLDIVRWCFAFSDAGALSKRIWLNCHWLGLCPPSPNPEAEQ